MVNELNSVAVWLYNRLANDPDGQDASGNPYSGLSTLVGGRVYEFIAPEGATYPLIVFTFLSGRDIKGGGGRRIISRGLFHVKAICTGNSFGPSGSIADRVDALLVQDESAEGNIVIGCNRERVLQSVDEDEGVRHNTLGGEYTFWISAEAQTVTSEIPSVPSGPSAFTLLQQQVTDLQTQLGTLQMSASLPQAQQPDPIVLFTATATLTRPSQSTVREVKPTANAVATLYTATGSGIKEMFDISGLGGFTFAVALASGDAYDANNTAVAAAIANLIASGAASFALRDVAPNTWHWE